MFKLTISKKNCNRPVTKMVSDERDATSEAGKVFKTNDDVMAVAVVENPGRTSTLVLWFDKNVSREQWVFPG